MVKVEFATPNLPNKMGPEAGQRWDSFDNIHIGFKGSYRHTTRWCGNMQMLLNL